MKTNTLKTSKKQNDLTGLVERGYAIHQQLLALNEEFKQIKDRLKSEAEFRPSEHIPLADKESQGSQWVILGQGCECRIIFPDVRVQAEFDSSDPKCNSIRSLAGDLFQSLFKETIVYRLVDKKSFREQVNHLIPQAATDLLDLTTSPSEPKALWKARPLTTLNS